MTDTPTYPPRRRGAPLRNLNALKHRIPRQRLASRRRPSDLEDLADCKFTDLKEEMTTPRVRVYMRSVIEQRGSTPSSAATLEESIEVLRAGLPVAVAAASLTRLARTQKFLDGSGQTMEGLAELLAEVNKEQGWQGVQK